MTEPTWEPNVRPTPEQLLDWLLVQPREKQIELAERFVDDSEVAQRCFVANHEGALHLLNQANRRIVELLNAQTAQNGPEQAPGATDAPSRVSPVIREGESA